MPRTGSRHEFDNFDDWENFDSEDDQFLGSELDLGDEWEDDGAIAEIREPAGESAEGYLLLDRTQSKSANVLLDLNGPSEDELSKIEEFGIDDYIDIVLAEDVENQTSDQTEDDQMAIENNSVEALKVQTEEFADDEDQEFSEELDLEIDEEIILEAESEQIDLVTKPIFEGLGVNLVTLFDEDGEVEYKNTARLAKRLCNQNVSAVFVATAEGEGNTLSRKERKLLIKSVSKHAEGLVFADATSPSIRQSVQIAEDCVGAGATGLMVTIDSNVRDPYTLCESLHNQHRDTSLFVRLVGNPDSIPISPEFLFDLPISGVIDATGDIAFFLHLIDAYSGPVYVGSTAMVLAGSAMGAAGVVLASAAIKGDLIEKAFDGDAASQAQISHWERETNGAAARSVKLALESENLVCSNMRD